MARNESDREDLLGEATALRRRAELAVPGESELIVVGYRDHGGLSIYFGPDPVYQFDRAGRLRRGFVDGALYRTQGETLARLIRRRTASATELRRHDLTDQERDRFLATMHERLRALLDLTKKDQSTVIRRFPPDDNILADLTASCRMILAAAHPLAAPIRGKR